jgi:hypothetical protein
MARRGSGRAARVAGLQRVLQGVRQVARRVRSARGQVRTARPERLDDGGRGAVLSPVRRFLEAPRTALGRPAALGAWEYDRGTRGRQRV